MLAKRRSSFQRLLQIHQEIQTNRYPNVTTLARSLEWSEKTIRRDLEYMRDSLDAPLAYDAHRRGFHYTRTNYQFPTIAVSEGELLGIFLGCQLMRQYRGTELGEHLARLFAKLSHMLPNKLEVNFSDLDRTYATRPAPVEPVEPTIMQALLQAVRECRRLEILYHTASRDLTQQRQVDPLGFHFVDGECQLIAFCHLREDIRTFSPARIRDLRPTPETFERPADFDLSKYLDEGFRQFRGSGPAQQVTLRFTPTIARHVQHRTYHPTQSTEPQPDGSLLLRIKVNHMQEVKRLALSFGPDCEVLEPASLREEYAVDVRAMAERILEQNPTEARHGK